MDLDQWLDRIQQLHPREIDMSLDRVRLVAERMGLLSLSHMPVVTVAGTNGKGSCVATVSALLTASGHRVGTFTSPHLLKYNERICIDGTPASDDTIVAAFEQIERHRGDVQLTYFEFGALAAFSVFCTSSVDALVLEVGLGGRLDAVNIIDASVAVISSIDLDHQEWLGDTRELIALEKAGIFRTGVPAVCADPDPPETLFAAAVAVACPFYLLGRDFSAHDEPGTPGRWCWQGMDGQGGTQVLRGLKDSGLLRVNVAAGIQAALLLSLPIRLDVLPEVVSELCLPGRQSVREVAQRRWLLDVSHNPHAAAQLARRIQREREAGRGIHLILAMMRDKDVTGYIRALESEADFWYIAQVNLVRCLGADDLLHRLVDAGVDPEHHSGPYNSIADACLDACSRASEDDTIGVCGSFFAVSEAMQWLAHR